jgi:hypothetical protein
MTLVELPADPTNGLLLSFGFLKTPATDCSSTPFFPKIIKINRAAECVYLDVYSFETSTDIATILYIYIYIYMRQILFTLVRVATLTINVHVLIYHFNVFI